MSRPIDALIKVAVGVIIANEKVLVALRPVHNPHGGLWEFPGGKFEVDESPFEALKRELYEEVGVEVIQASPLIKVQHDYGAVHIELDTWQIESFLNQPFGKEGQEIRWVNHDELLQLTFPEGNAAIVQKVAGVLLHQKIQSLSA
jgi:8-oxo-dGTP diphosphatase